MYLSPMSRGWAVPGCGERECKGHMASLGGGGRAAKKNPGLVLCKQPMWSIFTETEHSLWRRWRLEPCFGVLFPNKREISYLHICYYMFIKSHEYVMNWMSTRRGIETFPFSQLWMLDVFQSLLSGHSRLHLPALCCQRRWRAFSVDVAGSGAQMGSKHLKPNGCGDVPPNIGINGFRGF